jgi:SAM-dependent methyltransferase
MSLFATPEASHAHSLETLNALYEYDDFMESIGSVVDLGCGTGLDTEWWATRTTRDESPLPLNINCVGVDTLPELAVAKKYPNITYQQTDFEGTISLPSNRKFDILWSHDSFQYAINPITTLSNWWNIASPGGMLAIIVPQTTSLQQHQLSIVQESGCYYHYSLVSLIHMLAVTGWDCKAGFFLKRPRDPWLHAIVYKGEHKPQDPRTTTWYTLSEMGVLPECAEKSIHAHGYLKQQDLIIPWLDHSLSWMGQQ